MKIIIDMTLDGKGNVTSTQFVDLDPAAPATVTGVKGSVVPVNALVAIAALQADKTQLEAGGWNVPTQIPGHPIGTTRWQILVAEANKITATPEVQALKLT